MSAEESEDLTEKLEEKKAPWRSWRVPAVRHELLLYGELLAYALLLMAFRELILTPWSYGQYVQSLHDDQNPLGISDAAQISKQCKLLNDEIGESTKKKVTVEEFIAEKTRNPLCGGRLFQHKTSCRQYNSVPFGYEILNLQNVDISLLSAEDFMQATEPICCERVNNSSGCPCGYRKEDERCIALVSFKSDSLEDEIKKKGNKLCEGGGKLAGGNLSQSDIDFITKSHQADIRVLDLKKVNNDFFVRISTGEPEEISEFLAAKIIEMENGKSIFDGKPISFGPSIIENKSMQEVFVFCEARIGNEWWKS